jgi:hypothetical protein
LWRVFSREGLINYLPCWLQTEILLISASWVAKITGMSHRCLLWFSFIIQLIIFHLERIIFQVKFDSIPLSSFCKANARTPGASSVTLT